MEIYVSSQTSIDFTQLFDSQPFHIAIACCSQFSATKNWQSFLLFNRERALGRSARYLKCRWTNVKAIVLRRNLPAEKSCQRQTTIMIGAGWWDVRAPEDCLGWPGRRQHNNQPVQTISDARIWWSMTIDNYNLLLFWTNFLCNNQIIISWRWQTTQWRSCV